MDQENVLPSSSQDFPPSSPLVASSSLSTRNKPKKPPPITPRRFNKFFSPRDNASRSRAALQLKAFSSEPRAKRRRLDESSALIPIDSNSRDAFSSPIRRPYLSPLDEDDYSDGEQSDDEDQRNYCHPVRRSKVLQHFTAHPTFQRTPNYRNAIADFASCPEDSYDVEEDSEGAVPFCVGACNTNTLIAIGDGEGGLTLVDSARDQDFTTSFLKFSRNRNAIMDLEFSADDSHLATASGDQFGRIIDMPTQTVVYMLNGHSSTIKKIAFQPDEPKILATCGRDGTVGIWDVRCKTNRPLRSYRAALDPSLEGTSGYTPEVQVGMVHSIPPIPVRPTASSVTWTGANSPSSRSEAVTSLCFLPSSPHHLVTSSDHHSQLRLWDIRGKLPSRRSSTAVAQPVSMTEPLSSSRQNRLYGISHLSLNASGTRIYAVSKDSRVYAYATDHLYLGQAPLTSPRTTGLTGLAPLYAFEHANLTVETFYVRSSVRSPVADHEELLAVGGRNGPTLFPTDERYLKHQVPRAGQAPISPRKSRAKATNSCDFPVYKLGTTLTQGHFREVTGVCWNTEGSLMSISDDRKARRWIEDREKASELRNAAKHERWACGWSDVASEWDEDEG